MLECKLGKAPRFYGAIDLQQGFEEVLHLIQRPRIRTIAKRIVGVLVGLHKKTGNTSGDSCTRQYRNVLSLPAGTGALSTGKLY